MSLAARTKVTLLFLSASLVGALVGCSQKGEAVTSAHSATTEQQPDFEPNDVLDDSSMTDTSMTATDVQAFLDRTPYGKRSVLATYRPNKTKTAAQIIVQAALRYEINPMVLLVRAQLETELVSKTAATDAVLARALGCGCTTSTTSGSSAVCTPAAQAKGFENQVTCAASQLRTSLDRLTGKTKGAHPTTDGTAKGWATNERHTTRDGIEVIPDNDATAALYAYKPWVGKLGNGDPAVGGMSAYARLWSDFNASTTNDTTSRSSGSTTPDRPYEDPLPTPSTTSSCATACTYGRVCDETSGRCVECSLNDMSNCQAEGTGAACIAGRCGCEITADCGTGQGRICDRLHGVCIDGPNGSTGTTPPSDPPDADAGTSPSAPTTTVPTTDDPIPSEPTTSSTPDLPTTDSTTSKDGKRAADDKIEVPSSDSSGCSAAPSGLGSAPLGGASASLAAVGLALAAMRRRRKTAP